MLVLETRGLVMALKPVRAEQEKRTWAYMGSVGGASNGVPLVGVRQAKPPEAERF